MALPNLDRSVKPISTRGGADYTHHHITTSPPPPGISDLYTALNMVSHMFCVLLLVPTLVGIFELGNWLTVRSFK